MRLVKGDSLKDAIGRFHRVDVPGRDVGERTLAFRRLLGRFVDVCNAVAYALGVNFELGLALSEGHKPAEAEGYYRAALAVRPATPAVYTNLGKVLRDPGKGAEAAAEYRQAIALDPQRRPAPQ
jgi:tetratricopeptide (TPR) repeat protein